MNFIKLLNADNPIEINLDHVISFTKERRQKYMSASSFDEMVYEEHSFIEFCTVDGNLLCCEYYTNHEGCNKDYDLIEDYISLKQNDK